MMKPRRFKDLKISVVENGFIVNNERPGRGEGDLFSKGVFEFGSEAELVRYLAECIQQCTTEVEFADDGTSEQEFES